MKSTENDWSEWTVLRCLFWLPELAFTKQFVSFLLNDAEGFGIRISRRSAKDERSLVLITDLEDFLQVPAQLTFCLQSIEDIWKLRSHVHCRFQKMTICHLAILLNSNVCRYGKFPHFMSKEHTQQKTFWQAFEVKFESSLMQIKRFLSHFSQPAFSGNH